MPSRLYIKRLELSGFKSFVSRAVFNFDPGLTCVVGPNGCGKSNIIDAVRWVLGEQSARSLRGGRMEEMIFHGSERQKAVGMAEVSLTFDNEAGVIPRYGPEFSLTRRLYRSGESEYLINKEGVRLKDVTDVILDTGVSTGAYIIMEQGKIDYVLTARPSERVALFEEASGVMRYQLQKDEASRKLEATQQNLVRVGDIVHELKRQLDSLERQARQAEQFQQMRKRASDLKARARAGELLAGRKDMEDAERSSQEKRASLQAERARLGEKDAALKDSRSRQKKAEDGAAEISRGIADKREAQISFGRQLEELNLERHQLAVQIQERESRLREEAAEREKLASRAERARESEASDEGELARVQGELEAAVSREKSLEADRERLQGKLAERRQSLGDQADALHRPSGEPAGGAGSAVREASAGPLEEFRAAVPGVEWPLGRIFRSEEDHARAVQAALGPLAEAAVVETWDQAKSLLSSWREAREAPLTLVVLEALGEPSPRRELPEGALGWADELVAVPPKYAPLARALLGGVAVMPGEPESAPGSASGVALAYSSGVMLSAPGVVWWPGRLAHGRGATGAELAMLLSAAVRELGELEAGIVEVQADLSEAREKGGAIRVDAARLEQRLQGRRGERANLEQSAGETQAAIQRLNGELEGLKADLNRQEDEIGRREATHEQEERAIEEMTAKHGSMQDAAARIREEIQRAESELDEIRGRVDSAQQELVDLETRFYEARSKFDLVRHEFESEFGSEVGQLEELASQPLTEEEAGQLEKLSSRLSEIGEGVNLLALEEFNDLKSRHEDYQKQIEDLRASREKLQRAIYRLDRESEKRFNRTFDTIRENFHTQFRRLFGGGDADLKMVEEEDGERGIEIEARPPGKRAQPIALLSGGERALVSTSLLFALYMTKPSPFCFMDELDAPLDDANTGRFMKTVKEFNQQTQFVMITHNKSTMEMSDNLYGITMEEPGISKIVSIKLKSPIPVPQG